MRAKLLFFLALLAAVAVKSQTIFQKTYGKIPQDYGYTIQKTFDGAYVTAGLTNSYGGTNGLYLLKTDSLGDTLWMKGYATNGIIYGYSVQQTSDSGFIVAGNSGIIKTNAVGKVTWGVYYNGVLFYSARQTFDGGYIIAGTVGNSSSSNGIDIYLLKLNPAGIKQWSKKLGGPLDDVSTCIRQTADSGYVSLGYTTSFGAGSNDIYLVKMNRNGDTLWTRTYGGTNFEGGTSNRQNLEITSDSGFIIGSFTNSFGAGGNDAYVIKTKSNGDILWTRTYGGNGNEAIYCIKPTSDGGYVFTGFTTSFGGGNNDIYVVKTNAAGDTLWTRAFGGANSDIGEGIEETSDKGFMIACSASSFGNGNNDVLLIKTNAAGNSSCNQFYTATIVNSTTSAIGNTSTGKIYITLNSNNLGPTYRGGGIVTNICTPNDIKNTAQENTSFTVFPNPTEGEFTLSFNEDHTGKIKVSLSNILGDVIYSTVPCKDAVIHLPPGIANGIYFLKVEAEKTTVQQIIINR
ncbi:MAG TPA: T9SS type A sorting domain-containing protein [Bacteroidia bacterium]|jgi:hypothetical protein|nr:T9SS type A sorting domain-containing protein [Bacteroidia bacterium]